MIKLKITNTTARKINPAIFNRVAGLSSRELKIKRNVQISLVLVTDRAITRLNRQFLRRNRPTNVLSFQKNLSRKFILPGREKQSDGEIVISLETAQREAKAGGISLKAELSQLLTHGLLHIFGYNHEHVSESTAARMMRKENRILAKLAGSL